MNIPQILNAIVSLTPSPLEAGAAPDGKFSALVFKTVADPYVGKLSYFRVFSGTVHSDSHVWNATRNYEERLGQLFVIRGKTQGPVSQLGPGDLGAPQVRSS